GLHITWIKLIEEIEHRETYPRPDSSIAAHWNCDVPGDLQIKGRKLWKTPRVPWSHILAILVLNRVRKSGVQIVDRSKHQLPRCMKLARKQKAVRCVERKASLPVGLNNRLRCVSEELKEIVQVPVCA